MVPHLYYVRWHSTTDRRNAKKDAQVDTAHYSSTSGKNWVNFGPVTPELSRRVCAGRATRWALRHISSFQHSSSDIDYTDGRHSLDGTCRFRLD